MGRDGLFVCYCLLVIMWFLFGEVSPLPLGALDGLPYFIVALPESSISISISNYLFLLVGMFVCLRANVTVNKFSVILRRLLGFSQC